MSKKKSRVRIGVEIACVVSILGANALSLMTASPATAGCGIFGLETCPPERPIAPDVSGELGPTFQHKYIDGCIVTSPRVSLETGGTECGKQARGIIATAYCKTQGKSDWSSWKVEEGKDWSNRKSVMQIAMNYRDYDKAIQGRSSYSYKWIRTEGTFYFTQINCR